MTAPDTAIDKIGAPLTMRRFTATVLLTAVPLTALAAAPATALADSEATPNVGCCQPH
jgi:hypothetical protein